MSAWRDASTAKRLAALHRDDVCADITRHLLKQFRAGEITRDEYITRAMCVARMVLERKDAEIAPDAAISAHDAYLELELTARGLHPGDRPDGSQ